VLFIVLGLVCAVTSWYRWARAERAMRRSEPLPAFAVGAVLVIAVVASAVVLVVSEL
jgi:putative membrane protein